MKTALVLFRLQFKAALILLEDVTNIKLLANHLVN